MIWKKEETWKVEWDDRARKELRKLDQPIQKDIMTYMRVRIAGSKDPRLFGEGLVGNKAGLWRYRVRDFRLICKLEDNTLVVFVVSVGHRREIYEI
jgi:mRNA interferase RelE/StbE